MNILVIGNGFDIAHGLPTKYGDFLDFIRAFKEYNQSIEMHPGLDIDTTLQFYPCFTRLHNDNPRLYNEFKTYIYKNIWIDYFMSVFREREEEDKVGWIDFESEISHIIQVLDESRKYIGERAKEGEDDTRLPIWLFSQLKPVLFADRDDINSNNYFFRAQFVPIAKKNLIDDLNRLTRCLEIYLVECVEKIDVKPLKDIESLLIHNVLSFNYTNTCERLYRGKNGKVFDYDYIHGKANPEGCMNSCNMVLGIDEYLPKERKDNDNEFIEFKKFYQRIYRGTGCHYIDWINRNRRIVDELEAKSSIQPQVYIYGHSLDVTDKDILRNLIFQDKAITTIFYYDKNDLGKKIANLVKVIGEEELIRRTDGQNATIVFKETSKGT